MKVDSSAGMCCVIEKDGKFWESEEVQDQNATYTLGRYGHISKANVYPADTTVESVLNKDRCRELYGATARRLMIVTSFIFEDM